MRIEPPDAVTQEILASGFKHIAEEMAVVEYRSSYSPIIREMLDFNCGIFAADGRAIANSEQIPAQLGLMQFALESVIAKWSGRIEPDDAFITNHPYMGGTHTPDLQVFIPCFHAGELVAWSGSIAHHIDIGGRFPGTESAQCTELFQEGLIFPAVRFVERGQRVQAIYDMLEANVRDPASTLGDLDAQLAACKRGNQRLTETITRYGLPLVLGGFEALVAQTARRTEALFRSWPSEAVEAEGFLDDHGFEHTAPVRVHVRLSVEDGRLIVDLSGCSPQIPSGMNVPIASAHAAAYFAVRAFLGGTVPHNAGLASRVRLIIPEGTLYNPIFPAALSARHLAVQRLTDVIIDALSTLLPEHAIAGSQVSFPALVFQAVDPRSGDLTLLADILGGGGGARRHADGDDGIDPYTSNCAILPVEIAELEYPWLIERTELVEGSGGQGRYRGGMGIRRDYRLLAAESDGMFYVEQTNPRFGAGGREGGAAGAPGYAAIRRVATGETEVVHGKGYVTLHKGDVLILVGSGGGGFGVANTGS